MRDSQRKEREKRNPNSSCAINGTGFGTFQRKY